MANLFISPLKNFARLTKSANVMDYDNFFYSAINQQSS